MVVDTGWPLTVKEAAGLTGSEGGWHMAVDTSPTGWPLTEGLRRHMVEDTGATEISRWSV